MGRGVGRGVGWVAGVEGREGEWEKVGVHF